MEEIEYDLKDMKNNTKKSGKTMKNFWLSFERIYRI